MMLMRRMKVWSIYGISGLFVVFFSIFFLLRSMLMKRIRHMIDVSQLWGDGVLTIKMPVKRRDELGFLSECFNSMAGSLKEREDEIDGLYKDAKRSEKEWEETFNSINDIIVIKERDGTVSRANMAAARILKKPLNDIIGRSCHSLFFGKDRPCEPCFLNLTSPDGRAEVCEVTIPGVAGVFLATGHPFAVNDRNEVLSTVVVFTDVTHIKELSRIEMEVERLKDVNEFKSSVISLVSHELRNPLTSIVGYIELLHTRTVSENERDKWLSIVRNQAARMQVLIDNVLELSKTEAGKLEVKMVPADILDVVNSVIVRFNIESGRRMIKVDAADGLPLVDLDVDKISHAFFNLVENALKYSAEETDVLVRLRQKDHRIDISVEDNGIGIPSDYLEKIFEPFQRVQSDEILAIKGIGIGLSICRTIVRLHGGTVWVESELGKGSIFHVELPFIKR